MHSNHLLLRLVGISHLQLAFSNCGDTQATVIYPISGIIYSSHCNCLKKSSTNLLCTSNSKRSWHRNSWLCHPSREGFAWCL